MLESAAHLVVRGDEEELSVCIADVTPHEEEFNDGAIGISGLRW
jgi:hypothetical protein